MALVPGCSAVLGIGRGVNIDGPSVACLCLGCMIPDLQVCWVKDQQICMVQEP